MILINLLPAELRTREIKLINIPYRQIMLGLFGILLVFTLYNLFIYIKAKSEYDHLRKQWKGIAEKSAKADELEKELGATITAEVDFYDSLVDPVLQTARVLNIVSDFMPKTAWLAEFKFERNKKEIEMTLRGQSHTSGGAQLVDVQNFANNLKVEMEKLLVPTSQSSVDPRNRLNASVVTNSAKAEGNAGDVLQFTATLKSESMLQGKR